MVAFITAPVYCLQVPITDLVSTVIISNSVNLTTEVNLSVYCTAGGDKVCHEHPNKESRLHQTPGRWPHHSWSGLSSVIHVPVILGWGWSQLLHLHHQTRSGDIRPSTRSKVIKDHPRYICAHFENLFSCTSVYCSDCANVRQAAPASHR